MPAGSVGLDVGCGNGKYLGVNPSLFIIGTDRQASLSSSSLADYQIDQEALHQLQTMSSSMKLMSQMHSICHILPADSILPSVLP
jgi:hypothetical protein